MTASAICSFLYVPADRADRIAKARRSGADALLIDLEDAVALPAKEAARQIAFDSLRGPVEGGPVEGAPDGDGPDGADGPDGRGGPAVWVRINAGDLGRADIAALSTPSTGVAHVTHSSGLVLAKCDDPDWLDEVAAVIPSVPLSPLIESARGVRRLDALCAHARVTQCHLGEIDLLADVGAHGNAGLELLTQARAELVYASAAAGILPPIGGVFAEFRDLSGLAADSTHLAQMGFAGRPAIHPSQVPVINTAFRPTDDEFAAAAALVDSYDEALARGQGVVADALGKMIDEAVVRRARRLLGPRTPGEPKRRPGEDEEGRHTGRHTGQKVRTR